MNIDLCEKVNVDLDSVVDYAVEYAISKGLVMLKFEKNAEKMLEHIPFTLFPTPFPAETLRFLEEIQPHFNKLYHLAGQDKDFIKTSLKSGIESDEFIQRIYKIYEEVESSQHCKMEIGMIRSDYMLECKEINKTKRYYPKQIETNAMAVYNYCSATPKLKDLFSNTLEDSGLNQYVDHLTEGRAASIMAKCFVLGWETYGNVNASITFVIGQNERRIFEIHELEYEINSMNPGIPIRRKYFDELIDDVVVSEDNILFIDNEEVAVVCYLCADFMVDYKSEEHWRVRLDIEKSKAVKSPSIQTQLTECYTIQQAFSEPGAVERFIKDPEIATTLRRTFANLYSLPQNTSGYDAIKTALQNSKNYVVKPIKEEGIVYFEEEMVKLLEEIQHTNKQSMYILMERIFPETSKNIIVKNGKWSKDEIVSEIGIFGAYFCKDGKFVENYTAGHLLRSKPSKYNDATGIVTDIPLLV